MLWQENISEWADYFTTAPLPSQHPLSSTSYATQYTCSVFCHLVLLAFSGRISAETTVISTTSTISSTTPLPLGFITRGAADLIDMKSQNPVFFQKIGYSLFAALSP
jgi:hypothetical protein